MKNKTALRLAPVSLFGALLLCSTSGLAAGVSAGTLIENTASASFDTGGPTQSINSNKVTVKVDELLDVAVASLDAGSVPLTANAVLSYSITNTGNGPEAFKLTADPAVAGNDFDVTVTNLAIDTNNNGIYDAGDTIVANGGNSPLIDPDNTVTIFVLVSAPAGVTDGQSSQVNMLAQATTGSGTPGTVFASQGVNGGDAVVGTSGADDNALGSLTSSVITVNLAKTASILDPFGGSQSVPGAIVTYTLVATVSGSGAVNNLQITDPIPGSTTYVPSTLSLQGTGLTDLADTDAGQASASGISVNAGSVSAGSTRTVTFNVKVNQ